MPVISTFFGIMRHIAAWAGLRRPQLEANWAAMTAGQTLERIEPLK